MKYLLYISIFFCISGCKGHSTIDSSVIRPPIKKIIDSIAIENIVKTEHTGFGGTTSSQWRLFESLRQLASPKELKALTDNKNGVVRCYAFQALALKKDTSVFRILLNHLRDNENVSLMNYDVINEEKVGDYFVSVIKKGYNNLNDFKFSEARQADLDSILILGGNINLAAKYEWIVHTKPIAKYYARIKEIASIGKYPEVCISLARYQNKNDIPIIANLFKQEDSEYYGIYAVREFPDSSLYQKLVVVFENEWRKKTSSSRKCRILFQALTKYPNQQTLQLFERTLKLKDNYRYNTLATYLMIAITKYPNPLFEPLKNKIHLGSIYKDDVANEMNIEE